MTNLDTLDLCARLDRLKTLCDRLEEAQDDRTKYRTLVNRVCAEADSFHQTICAYEKAERSS